MPSLPGVTNTLSLGSAAASSADDLICLICPCATSADATARRFNGATALYDQHGYCEAVEYADGHPGPVLMVGIPIVTAGAISRDNTSGNTGTCATTVTAGGSGVLAEHDGILKVTTGGTIGTSQIVLSLSLDNGKSYKAVRLGTASSYTIPYVGASISFAAGTLVAGDTIHTWHGSGPRGDSSGWADAFTALKAQARQIRSIMMFGDAQNDTEVAALYTLLLAYDTTSKRPTQARWGVIDRLPLASMASTSHTMTTANVTFAEVGATGDTITRSTGSWASDGFATGDILTISGSSSNNGTLAAVATVTNATVITLDTDDLADEGPVAGVSIVGEPSLTFSDSADTIVRAGGTPGSWLTDGFRVGDSVTISGTSSNNGTFTVTAVTATTITFETDDLADEVIGISSATIAAGQTKAAWLAAIDTEFAPIDDKHHIDLSMGKGRTFSKFSQWNLRWPSAWFASWREYQHDLHTPCWRKMDGPVPADLYDTDGNLVEWDDYVDTGASAARFTSLRTYPNGPAGAFVAFSSTRALDSSVLVNMHVAQVVNRARIVAQQAAEDIVGRTVRKNSDGTATTESLREIASYVNAIVQGDMLTNKRGEGPRCSNIQWTPADDDDFSVPAPILNSTLAIDILGTVHTINITIEVR